MPRIHYSDDVREAAVDLVLTSHIPATEVAREVGCSVFTIHSWVKKHRSRSLDPPSDSPRPATFIPVHFVDAKSVSVEIVTPNGFTVRLGDLSSQSLVELLTALTSC
ncbi:MAG TPA: hypothetical protein DEB39_06765 [Planctomycetaceae bacterium]|nr:hypothetical protein [Planctomycetaceae bacterium]